MKITGVEANPRKQAFEVRTPQGAFELPYAKCAPIPSAGDRVSAVYVDDELGREAFTYQLESGLEGTVHGAQVLDYHQGPA